MDKVINIDGKKIFYRVSGKGRAVMLVHGFGETGAVWDPQVDHLKSHFQLIVPDLPGSGRSEMIDDMSMEGLAGILKTIVDEEGGIDQTQNIKDRSASPVRPAIIGHSMGGYITLALIEKYGGFFGCFGLCHSSAFADTEEKKAARRKGIAFIKERGAFEFLKNATPNLFSPRSRREFPELIDQFVQGLNNFSPESLVSYYESMIKRPDRTGVLKTTALPVLFVMGEQDTAIPLQDGLKLCHLPEKSYFHVLHQSGHMGMLEEPEKTSRLLEEFLTEE